MSIKHTYIYFIAFLSDYKRIKLILISSYHHKYQIGSTNTRLIYNYRVYKFIYT